MHETAYTQTALWTCVTLSGNSGAGFSQCMSLPAPVPFQYSGNLCSSWEGLADTTQQPESGRGTVTREKERQRGGHERNKRWKRERDSKRGEMRSEMKQDKKKKKVGNHKRGERTSQLTEQEKKRWEGQECKRKGDWVCGRKRRGQQKKRRGRRGGSRQGRRGLDRGVKSGDLQVQLEQPMTLMVH